MTRHSHKFTIAGEDAVGALVKKLANVGRHQQRSETLLRPLEDATRYYKDSDQKVRQAFFHGLLTGYAVEPNFGSPRKESLLRREARYWRKDN